MLKIDNNLLEEIGLGGLPPQEKNRLLAQIYETLELRVGMTLASQMSEAQLTEFEQFVDGGDETGALKWLEANFPNYKDVVAQELDKLKAEIQRDSAKIVEAAQAAAAQAPQVPPQQQPPLDPGAPQQPPADPNQPLPPQ